MLLFGAISMLMISAWVYNFVFLSHSLVIMVVYIWSRRNPNEHLNLLGLFTISAPYLAYVMLGFTALLGGGVSAAAIDIVGIVVGHVYWFLADIWPAVTGFHILKTPGFVSALFPDDEIGHEPWRPAFD
jgi:Derlin-2/3